MSFQIEKTALATILELREHYLQEMNAQIRYNARHERNWTDSYQIRHGDQTIGYASVMGADRIEERDCLFEFFVITGYRNQQAKIFQQLIRETGVSRLTCQTNDPFMFPMMMEFGQDMHAEVMLFRDQRTTAWTLPDFLFRPRQDDHQVFEHHSEPVGNYVVCFEQEVVATGGFMLHYNFPYADIYMEVREDMRNKGIGTYLVQELKKHAYLEGRVPAARCNLSNLASQANLFKAGFACAGYMLEGRVKQISATMPAVPGQ